MRNRLGIALGALVLCGALLAIPHSRTANVPASGPATAQGIPVFNGSINVYTGATATLAGAVPTALPSICYGGDATFVLRSFPCANAGGVGVSSLAATSPVTTTGSTGAITIGCATCLTGLTAGNDIVVGTGPSPSVAVTNAPTFSGLTTTGTLAFSATPAATACPASMVGLSAANAVVSQTGCAAIANSSKTSFAFTVLPTGTSLATPAAGYFTHAVMVPIDINNPTVDGAFAYCDVAGTGGVAITFQFYVSFGVTPTFTTPNPVGTSVSWAAATSIGGGATFPATALPTSTTPGLPTWLFAVVKAGPNTPPSGNCPFTLTGLQKITL